MEGSLQQTSVSAGQAPIDFDRHVYWLFVVAAAVTLFGFFPTFYAQPGKLDVVRLVHGIFATSWMLLLIVQPWLIGRRHWATHRRVGRIGLFIAAGLVVSAAFVVREMVVAGPEGFPPKLRMALTYIDVTSLCFFMVCVALAIRFRRRRSLHARFLGVTALIAIVPALGRAYGMNIPAIGGLRGALAPSFFTVDAVLLALLAFDWHNRRRIEAPYVAALAYFVILHATLWPVASWLAGPG
jgi:hypothetical protein